MIPAGAVIEAARATAGAIDLVAPGRVGRAEAMGRDPFPPVVLRVLGTRQLLQAGLLVRADGPPHHIGAVVDVLHAASMAALAVISTRHRSAARTQLIIAAGLALAEAAVARPSR